MEVERIARKLEPLLPGQVQRWLRVRDTAYAELKTLIDQQIVTTAHRVLGDFRNKILLSLPPPKLCAGPVHLGTVLYDRPRWPFGLTTSELLQHVAVFGRSGAGKTNVAFALLRQLADRKIPFLFLDWKRTARHLLPHLKGKVNLYTPGRPLAPLAFNPFVAPPGLEPNVYINQVVDVLADAYTLGDGVRSVLQRALAACHRNGNVAPQVSEVLAEVDKLPGTDRARGWKVSAVRALESLAFSELTSKNVLSQEQLVQGLLLESTIIELDALSQSAKKFLVPLVCLWVYHVQLAAPVREKLRLVIVVEEAHHVLYRQSHRTSESLLNVLLRQCREVGIAMVVIDQHPHLVSSAALGNAYASICLNLKDPADINRAAALSLIDEEDKRCFTTLPVGQGIVKLQDRWRRPFLVQFPLVNVAKGAVTDAVLRGYLRRKGTGFGRKLLESQEFGRVSRSPMWDRTLDATALRFLEDVREHPDDGVKTRYRRLGLSAGRGTRLKESLVEDGWLNSLVVPVGQGRKVILRMTREAHRALGLEADSSSRGSLAHDYWKQCYARQFQTLGYQVELEAPRHGGRVDVLAIKGDERIGIEIETGQSDVVANVRHCLRSGFAKVVVVAVDGLAMTKIERQLARQGLIIRGRVHIESAGKFAQSSTSHT